MYRRWVGGNNFGRWTGDSVTTMYAADATMCPDGIPHEPKFSQFTAMHEAIAAAAADIVNNPAQLDKPIQVNHSSAYVYGNVAFIEGMGGDVSLHGHTFDVPVGSSSLVNLTNGATLFNTKTWASIETVSGTHCDTAVV